MMIIGALRWGGQYWLNWRNS